MSVKEVQITNEQRDQIVNSIAGGLKSAIRKAVDEYLDDLPSKEALGNKKRDGGFKLPKGDE